MNAAAETIRILLIDDHEIVREGLRLYLQQTPDLVPVATAADGASGIALGLRLAARNELDVIVTDLGLPDCSGLEVVRRIKAEYPQMRVLVLSMYTDDEHIRGVMASGADGYLLKQAAVADLPGGIRAVARGEMALSPLVARRFMTRFRQQESSHSLAQLLTVREREVLQLLATGATTKEIARHYGCQPKTVENHRCRILAKLDVNNTASAISLGYQRGLIAIDSAA